MLLRNPNAGMAEQYRNLVDRNAGQQHLHRESVAEHIAVSAFHAAIGLAVRHSESCEVGKLVDLLRTKTFSLKVQNTLFPFFHLFDDSASVLRYPQLLSSRITPKFCRSRTSSATDPSR
jgi:hypothetical protein